jgi:hypothetical protein
MNAALDESAQDEAIDAYSRCIAEVASRIMVSRFWQRSPEHPRAEQHRRWRLRREAFSRLRIPAMPKAARATGRGPPASRATAPVEKQSLRRNA